MLLNHFIISVVDEVVLRILVAGDAQLGFGVLRQRVAVAVEVVGGDVEQHGHPGAEVVGVVELEAAQLHHVVVGRILNNLLGQGVAHVAGQAHVQPRRLQQVVGK